MKMEDKSNVNIDSNMLRHEANDVVSDSTNEVRSHVDTDHKETAEALISSTEKQEFVESLKLATHHLAAGKKDLLISDPSAAVTSLSLACELLGSHYGEMAVECSEAYYYYGRALLELARLEGGVIEKQEEDLESEDEGAVDSNGQSKSSEPSGNDGPVDKEKRGYGNDVNGSGDQLNIGSDQESGSEKEGEPSNLQLAWEMFELTKTILVNQIDSIQIVNAADDAEAEKKAKLKGEIESRISDTFQCLAELSIENENYTQAIEDLETCLTRRQQILPEDSRCIAETHYQLGVAKGFNLQFDESITSLETAIDVLQTRIEKLKAKTESTNAAQTNDSFYSRENEIKEIESLIPDIRVKIADTKDMKTEVLRKLGHKKALEDGIAANIRSDNLGSSTAGPSKTASTISSTLIKKRPATDSSFSESKKIHLETSEANSTSTEDVRSNES